MAGSEVAEIMLFRLITPFTEDILAETQCDFRKKKKKKGSTLDLIFTARQV